jgi:TonB family protein
VVEERQPALAAAAVTSFTPGFAGATRATAPAPVKPAAAAPAAPAAPRAVASATVASRLPEFAGAKEAAATALNKTATPIAAPRPPATTPVVSFTPKPAGFEKPSTPAPKVGVPPAPKVAAAPVPAAPAPRPAVPADDRPPAVIAPSGVFKNKLVLGVAILVVLLAAGGFYFVQTQRQEAARLAAEKAKTEQRLQAEIARSRLIEQQAKAEAEARKKLEIESARRLSEAESGRERAENEARAQAAARLANARGTLVITTEPAGATVTVGNLPPRVSPATFSDLKIGRYPVTIALPLYDTAQIEFDIKEDTVTDPGVLKLVRPVGTLELTTEPASVAYEVRPANSLLVLPEARRTGRTPDTLADLTPGEYTVTFVRDGWMPHSANVTVERNGTAQAKWSFPNGIVKITSKPAGATVTRDGVNLGVTPLTIGDLVPGDVTYQVTLPGYAPDQVTGHIVGGEVVELVAQLDKWDHISLASELDQQPKVIATAQPKIPYEYRQGNKSGQVNIELTVTRDGSTKDLVVLPGSDRALAPACLKAASQWKFKPGSIHGRPVNVRVIVPFSIQTE